MGTDSHQALLEPTTLLGFFLQVCVGLYKVKMFTGIYFLGHQRG